MSCGSDRLRCSQRLQPFRRLPLQGLHLLLFDIIRKSRRAGENRPQPQLAPHLLRGSRHPLRGPEGLRQDHPGEIEAEDQGDIQGVEG